MGGPAGGCPRGPVPSRAGRPRGTARSWISSAPATEGERAGQGSWSRPTRRMPAGEGEEGDDGVVGEGSRGVNGERGAGCRPAGSRTAGERGAGVVRPVPSTAALDSDGASCAGAPGPVAPELTSLEQHTDVNHRDVKGGGARAAVFGVSDGLVSNVAIVLGVAGAHPNASVVVLAGMAGLIGGAWSMAAGEYISMRAQQELFERELAIEKAEIGRRPDGEAVELAAIYRERGLPAALADEVARELMRDPDRALAAHAREELGIDIAELGSPVQAAASSLVSFALGALLPLLPWFFARGSSALVATVTSAAAGALVIGGALAVFTGRSVARSALRQLLVSGLAGAVTFGVGSVLRGSL